MNFVLGSVTEYIPIVISATNKVLFGHMLFEWADIVGTMYYIECKYRLEQLYIC